MPYRIKKLSDLTVERGRNTLILERSDTDTKFHNKKNLVHLSGVTRQRDWRMRLTELKLAYKYVLRSFRSLVYGRATPLNIAEMKSSKIHGEGYAAPVRNSLMFWTSQQAFNFAAVVIFAILTVNVTIALYNGSRASKLILAASQEGADALLSAKNAVLQFNFAEASEEFAKAQNSFAHAEEQLASVTRTVHLISASPLAASQHLIRSGELLAESGTALTETAEVFQKTFSIDDAAEPLERAFLALQEATGELEATDTSLLPGSLQSQISTAQREVRAVETELARMMGYIPAVKAALGYDRPMRYLIVFQNTGEKRGTGGFIGSFSELTVENGSIVSLIPEDIYRIDWCMKPGAELPQTPAALRPHIESFHMRDANYSPDFPTSAKWLQWFYENSCDGKPIDGVIAIDETILRDLLHSTGPVPLPAYDVTLTSENYYEVLQFFIETSKDQSSTLQADGRRGTPKQILIDLIPRMRERLTQSGHEKTLIDLVLTGVKERHIQAYFSSSELQTLAEEGGIAGAVSSSTQKLDYLSVIHMNIGGNKSDRFIDEAITHESSIGEDGVVTDTVTIRRTHTFDMESLAEMHTRAPQIIYNSDSKEQQAHVEFVLGNGPNKTFSRIFVPEDSVLTDVTGIASNAITSDTEAGKTVYGFTWELKPGETKEIKLTYVLPFVLNLADIDTYRLMAQKQAGSENIAFTKTLSLSDHVAIARNYPEQSDGGGEQSEYHTTFDRDRYFANVLQLYP